MPETLHLADRYMPGHWDIGSDYVKHSSVLSWSLTVVMSVGRWVLRGAL